MIIHRLNSIGPTGALPRRRDVPSSDGYEGANGKGVVCAALAAMLGVNNCSFVPLEMFGDRFQLAQTVGKLANIAPECGEIDRVAEGVLKSYTSGDLMQFDRKFKTPIQVAPTARFILPTNNRPRFSDRSSGLWRRMILIPLRVVIPEPDRIAGMDKPDYWHRIGELPGILNWALQGLGRLRKNGRFTKAKVCEDALADYRIECNPAREFLLTFFEPDAQHQILCKDVFECYQKWGIANGYQPLGASKFGVEVSRTFPTVQKRRVGGRGSQQAVYAGLAEISAPRPPMRSSS